MRKNVLEHNLFTSKKRERKQVLLVHSFLPPLLAHPETQL